MNSYTEVKPGQTKTNVQIKVVQAEPFSMYRFQSSVLSK